jgi:hypothetical protein
MGHQPIAEGGQQIRQQRQAVALREQHQQLADNRSDAGATDSLGDGVPLPGRRNSRVHQDLGDRGLGKEVGKRRELALDPRKLVLLLDGDIEERTGIAMSSGTAGDG